MPAAEQLDQLRVCASLEVLPDPLFGKRIQRSGDLDMEVAVDLDSGEDRHVIRRRDG